MTTLPATPRLGYLSGAPRVSTRPDAETAGPRTHILGTLSGFAGLGWEVAPYIVGDEMPRMVTGAGSERMLARSYAHRLAADVARLGLGLRNGYRARRTLGRVDWVYERFAVMQALGWPFARAGVPWILETQGPFFLEAAGDRKSIALPAVAKAMERAAYRRADVLVCVTERLKELLVDALDLDPDRLLVVRNAANPEALDPAHFTPERVLDQPVVLGFVGACIAWQGLDMLMEAMAELAAEGVDLGLVAVGDGPMCEPWQELAGRLGLSDRVRFVGLKPGPEVPRYILGADVGYSGQVRTRSGAMYHSPLKLYECMALGRPVLATAYEDACATIHDGEDGFLCPPDSRQALMETLRGVWQARERLAAMGERARQTILDSHTWAIRCRQVVDGTLRILDRASGRGGR